MKMIAIAALVATLPVATAGAASAQAATGMMNGVQHVGAKARCSPGDPNVMVNKTAKTFVLDKSATAATMKPGASKMTGDAMDAGSAGASKAAMVSMCKSEAVSMGAKMGGAPMGGSMKMKKSAM
ncbi:MAG: hypothetical protein NVS2B3_01820 [Vulcanimicrobiaceae bacterium]